MKKLLAIGVLMLVITCLAFGQQQTAPPPKPGPEVQRLGSMIGTWKTDAGETVTYEWFDGGFSVIGHVENSGPEYFVQGYCAPCFEKLPKKRFGPTSDRRQSSRADS